MITKLQSISHLNASVDYARKMNEPEEKRGIILDRNMVVGETGNEVFQEFKIFQNLNTRCEKNTIGIVLSPVQEDSKKMSNDQFVELSRDFLKRLGLEQHQSITILHPHDTHHHLHIYVNRIDLDGKAYNDSFISKKGQQIADELAIDLNITRANEVEMANKIIKQPTLEKIREIYSKVISDPKTNYDNVFHKLEQQSLQITFNKEQPGKKDGYTVALHGIQFKASEIDKSYSFQQLKGTIEKYQTGKNSQANVPTKERIQRIFAQAIIENGIITPHSFLTRVSEKGVEIHPTLNSQGKVQGYRVVMDGMNFKSSEIGNKYTLAKLENTIKIEGGKSNSSPSIKNDPNTPSFQEQIMKIISNEVVEQDTTPENFHQKIANRGIKTAPITNDKNEITNYSIEFANNQFLATDLCLKYTLEKPERLISETRAIQKKEQLVPTRDQIKEEVIQLYQESFSLNLPNAKALFDNLKEQGIKFEAIDKKDYKIQYKSEQFTATELNDNFRLDKIESLMENYRLIPPKTNYSIDFQEKHEFDKYENLKLKINQSIQGEPNTGNIYNVLAKNDILIDKNIQVPSMINPKLYEIEIAQKIINQPTLNKIKDIYIEVLSGPITSTRNFLLKLEQHGLQITLDKGQDGKVKDYAIVLHGIQFKASDINKAYSYHQLQSTIEQHHLGLKNPTNNTPKEKIQKIFAEAISEKGMTPQSFFTKVKEKGVEIQPTVNSQGNVQGYRAILEGESFKASEIGNKYTIAKLEQTIKNEAGKPAPYGLKNIDQNKPTLQDQLCTIISNVISNKETTLDNFLHKIGEKGINVMPIKNDKGALTNFTIEFDNSRVLATEVGLKYTLENPGVLISETRDIQVKENLFQTRNQFKQEVIQLFQDSLNSNLPNTESLFDNLKEKGLEFKAIDRTDYQIQYKSEQYRASELNQNFQLDRIDKLMENYNKSPQQNGYANEYLQIMDINNPIDLHSEADQPVNSEPDSDNDFSAAIESLINFTPMRRSNDYEEDSEENKRRWKKKHQNNNDLNI